MFQNDLPGNKGSHRISPDIEGGSWMKKLSSFPKWDISDRFVGVLSTPPEN